ncbi:YceD family protein [Virgibacillus sp. 179-BFC.A HS]|uniref:YceD family protein n=1 Tax=Tigheibacillus jepli TaxID=3035914 RepID=A0ABU5CI52_9BACI|nr:YceD family protein [Virgibacillus sp. 179-BFC.A HS]MDY0405976.1 YceD family protein [Virgibacillus sp. 179-BFC.A HS]
MKFTLTQIKKSAHQQPFSFEGDVDVSELEKMNNDIRKIGHVHVKGECNLQGNEFIFSFTIHGKMILPCARTLVDVPYPFDIHATEIFSTSEAYKEDDEIHPIHGEVLDLTPYIKENILLEVPFRVFSDDPEAMKKGVPSEGRDWEVITEETDKKTIDPRLQKLASLLKDDNNKS